MILRSTQTDLPDSGMLRVDVVSSADNYPVRDARVTISPEPPSNTNQNANPQDSSTVLEELTTDDSGQTEEISLPAPPIEYSLDSEAPKPYSEYLLTITAPGYEPLTISGTEILPTILALQPVRLNPLAEGPEPEVVIPEHTLYGIYPPKIPEDEVKPVTQDEIVLSRVVVPETIVVHDGMPSNSSARNYFVPYRDYIKNVASSEIYATWPRSTITANILAILSFTLNRVYTEW